MKCVHLDFHTSPLIPDIGVKFDKEKFAKTFKDAKVDLVTLFAKCHHGYTYYPSKVGTTHPNLKFNLLKEQVEALRSANIKAVCYITAGWSKLDADNHPEWHSCDFNGKPFDCKISTAKEDFDKPLEILRWQNLCLASGYSKVLEDTTRELCESIDVSDGVFYDICFSYYVCGCKACKEGMKKLGLDPENEKDGEKYYIIKRIELMKKLTGIVHEYYKDAPVFYNGGAEVYRPQYHPYQSHFELEDLPTIINGYDNMPLRAKYFDRYDKRYLGMTGKFHLTWGEFGGYKNKEALRYECADMVSLGASISVGDHLHPSGETDVETYKIIGHAFSYIDKIEKYCENTKAVSDIALYLGSNSASNMGAIKILQIMHVEHDVIVAGDDLTKYKCIIIPDKADFTNEDKLSLVKYLKGGGKIVCSNQAVFSELGVNKIEPSKCDVDYIKCSVGDFETPFISYSSAYITESDGETLATVYEPYFNRTHGHFSGHQYTPYKSQPASYPALVRKGNLIYFAHPVFEAYNKWGNFVLENYIINGIDLAYDRSIVTTELPSCGRVRLRQNDKGELTLHVLYAPPVNRGCVWILPDFPTLHNVTIKIRTNKNVTKAIAVPSNEEVKFSKDGEFITVYMPPFSLHQLIVLK